MLERLKQLVSPYSKAHHWYIAYSGGLDSHVLLHAIACLAKQSPDFPPITAVHVNHQIQSASYDWEVHCRQQAALSGVGFISYRVNVDTAANIEERAREARYDVFSGLLQEGDCIFFAHHQQDQVETFFYRLFRGAGVKGLQAIIPERMLGKGKLVRPFLQFERAALEYYAFSNELEFVIDPSNTDVTYDRNFIRHHLLPVIHNRWPAFKTVIERVIAHLRDSAELLDEIALADLSGLDYKDGVQPSLSLKQLPQFSPNRQKNIVRYWLALHSVVLSSQQTHELFRSVIYARMDAQPLLNIGNVCIRRYQQQLFITLPIQKMPEIHWNGLSHCMLEGYGDIYLSQPLDIELTIKRRVGGESIKPSGSAHTRKLKALLQEMDIPPWQRENLPLIYIGDKLISVAGLITSEDAHSYLQGRSIILSPVKA